MYNGKMISDGQLHKDATLSGRFARLWPLLWIVWLPNLGVPLQALFHDHVTPLRLGAVLAGVTAFVAVYLWAAAHNDFSRIIYPASTQQRPTRWRWVPVAVLVSLSVALILGDGSRWLVLLIFTSASAGGRFSLGSALWVLAALAALAAVLGWLTHASASDVGQGAFWAGMAGILVIILNHFRMTNRALQLAREENAHLAVEAERLRFARDLHDLLGHDLARLALQSEVAEYLVRTEPDRAIEAIREMGGVARTALQEVRAAVAGYRQPTLDSELRGAGEILAAAGIAYRYEGERITAPPALEAVLAWTVREGVTNVVKHSRARHCTIRTMQEAGSVGIEVYDDGPASNGAISAASGSGGSGLAGLAERAAALGGRCDAAPCPGGGFRLSVILPLGQDKGTERTPQEHAAPMEVGVHL